MKSLIYLFIYLFTCSCITKRSEWKDILQEPELKNFVGVWKCTTEEKKIIFYPDNTFKLEYGDSLRVDEGIFFFKERSDEWQLMMRFKNNESYTNGLLKNYFITIHSKDSTIKILEPTSADRRLIYYKE